MDLPAKPRAAGPYWRPRQTASRSLARLRVAEASLVGRFEVAGGRPVTRAVAPVGLVCCVISIVGMVADLRRIGYQPRIGAMVAVTSLYAVVLALLMVFGSRRVTTYGCTAMFFALPLAVLGVNLHSSDVAHTVAAVGWLPTLPVFALVLWGTRRSWPLITLIFGLSTAVVVTLVVTGDLPSDLAASVVAQCIGTGLCVTWSAAQRDREDIDPVTGLHSRGRLRRDLDVTVRRAASGSRAGHAYLVLVDVDGLAAVSRQRGRSRADDLLVRFGQSLQSSLPVGSSAYALGAGTFAALVPAAGLTAGDVATCAQQALPPGITGCVGVALPLGAPTPRELFRSAEASLVRAKAHGPGALDPRIDDQWIAHDLQIALEEGALRVVYQPIVDLDDGTVVGSEALVRWMHPERGVVSPDVFIGYAEDSGLIRDLGRHVLLTACAEAAAAERNGHRMDRLNVNVSPTELHADGYAFEVLDILRATGLDPRRLVLEVTESSLIGDDQEVSVTLRTLRAHGVRIAIDDFGTGYSSLSRLAGLPIDILKIDKSFVWLPPDTGRDHLIGAIVALADAFGIHTVAEGIETSEQAELLKLRGCRYAQGYLFGRPTTYEDVVRRSGVADRRTADVLPPAQWRQDRATAQRPVEASPGYKGGIE